MTAALGLHAAGSRRLVPLALVVGACACFALAAAQPSIRETRNRTLRTDAQAFFVVDVSRSMLARRSPGGQTRLARARSLARTLRGAIPAVPSGVASLTDRVLPYVFPTGDERVFASTLHDAVLVETPPPQQVSRVASTLGALGQLSSGFFTRQASRRTCVVLTDGESRPFSAEATGRQLAGQRGCRLLVVQLWHPDERVFGAGGTLEPQYRPDPEAPAAVAALARAAGGASYTEAQVGAAAAALRRDVGEGPAHRTSTETTRRPLAPWLAAAGLVLVLALVGSALPARLAT